MAARTVSEWGLHREISGMPKAIFVEDHQLDQALKVAGVTGRCRRRNQALLLAVFGTALTPTELAEPPRVSRRPVGLSQTVAA